MLLGANLIFAGPSEEKLLDGVCFYLTDVPAGTTILGTCGKVFSEGVEWSIDFGDGTGTQVFSTTANIPAHTYDSAGDYVIQIIGSGITTIKPVSTSYYPVIATTANADCPYVTSITVGSDFSFFPFTPYSAGARFIRGPWNWFTNLKDIKLAKSVIECTKSGCLANVFRYGDVEFVAPGVQLITGDHAIRYSVYRDPCALLPRGQTDLDDSWFIFANATSLEDVSGLPRGLAGAIPSYAFSGCSKLSDISAMPDGVTDIGSYAFSNCKSLVVADLKNIVTLGPSSFSGCSALTDIYVKGVGHTSSTKSESNFLTTAIAPNVTLHYVGDVPAYDCKFATYLEHLDISKAQNVGVYAFQNCTALESILFGNSTKTNPAFSGCNAITSVRHAATGDTCWFGQGVLMSNTSPFTIFIPDNVKTLLNQPPTDLGNWYGSFSGCTGITSLDLRNVETIGVKGTTHGGIFEKCTSLTEITATKLKHIYSPSCFSGCTSLTTLNMPLLETVGTSVFKGCSQVTELPPNCKRFGSSSFYGTSVTLDTLTIPKDGFVRSEAFYGCSFSHIVDERLSAVDSGLTSPPSNGIYCNILNLEDVTFPNMTVAGDFEFSGMLRMSKTATRVEMPKLKTVYGRYTFRAMTYPEKVGATQTSSALSAFELPSLESIGYSASGTTVQESVNTFLQSFPYASGMADFKLPALKKIYNNTQYTASGSYGTFGSLSDTSYDGVKRLYLPQLNSITGNCAKYILSDNAYLEEVHFGVANKSYITSHAGWSTLFGLGTSWPGKIYFDLNPDGTVSTNPDGSPIEPDYDGSV